jgi:hypothetical protein
MVGQFGLLFFTIVLRDSYAIQNRDDSETIGAP